MKTFFTSFCIITCLLNFAQAQFMTKKEASQINTLLQDLSKNHKPKTYLFKNVNIISMINGKEIQKINVLIEDGLIKSITKEIHHEEAIEIDGNGKYYLMPGLTDTHIHIFNNHQMKNTWLLLLLLHGVTTIRDMAGESGKLILKEKIKNNEILAPNLYQAGPIINGKSDTNPFGFAVINTPEKGRQEVQKQKKLGYDFIKVYNNLDEKVYWAMLDEAQKLNILVVGHLPESINLFEVLGKQSSIEHLFGYKKWRNQAEAYISVDADYATKTAVSNTWNCPTLYNLVINWEKSLAEEVTTNTQIIGLLPKTLLRKWQGLLARNPKQKIALIEKYAENNKKVFRDIVSNLYQAKAKLIAGTDSGNLPLMIPGYALHEELRELHKTGIPVYDVLKMATIHAAQALGKDNEFGSIEVGKRADLLLLNQNPLENLNHLLDKQGLMVRGIWLDNSELTNISDRVKTIFGNN